MSNSQPHPPKQRPKRPRDPQKRASRACRRCRNRKSRCIATDSGVCWRCRRNGLSCTYDNYTAEEESISTPGISDPSLLGSNLESNPLISSHDQPDILGSSQHREPLSRNSQMHTRPPPLPESATARAEIPSLTTENLSQNHDYDDYDDAISRGSFIARVRETMFMGPSDSIPVTGEFIQGGQAQNLFKDLSDQSVQLEAIRSFPPKEIAYFLLNAFYDHGIDSFFYLDQARLQRGLARIYDNPDSHQKLESPFICSALMALAIGSQFAHLKSPASSDPRVSELPHDPGLIFYKSARRLFPEIIECCSLEAIQTCLLMSIFLLPSNPRDLSYLYLSLALKIAIATGLHRKTVGTSISQQGIEIRSRLWWTVYSLERSFSIKLGRPESIKAEEIDAPLPQPLPLLDETQVYDNIYHQIANARLTQVLNRVVQHLPSASDFQATNTATLDNLKAELKKWRDDLPPALRLENLDPRTKGFRAGIHLHQNYHHAWIIMCRVPLLVLVRERLRKEFMEPSFKAVKDARVEKMAHACVKAARKMLHLFETLSKNESLARFSFTDFHGCSMATIVTLLHGILERDPGYASSVKFAFDSLRFMAAGNDTAKIGVRFVESFQSLADEAVDRMKRVPARAPVASEEPAASTADTNHARYGDWLRWVSTSSLQSGAGQHTYDSSTQPASRRSAGTETPALLADQQEDGSEKDPPCHVGDRVSVESLITSAPADGGALEQGTVELDMFSMPDFYNYDDTFMFGFTGLDVLNFPVANM